MQPKVAVLISGEYRTFDICRPTMTFLDDPNVDVYVSTWDRTICKNERLNVNINELITVERVENALKRPATILVEPIDSFPPEKRYNSKMIHRWKAGWELIKNSGIEYDWVLVVRPDLFFNSIGMFTIESLIKQGKVQFAWYESGAKLQDCMFFGPGNWISNVFEKLEVDQWVTTQESDWHTWWTSLVAPLDIISIGQQVQFAFCRDFKPAPTFDEVSQVFADWNYSTIIDQIQQYSRNAAVANWGESRVVEAEIKSNTNYFNKYQTKWAEPPI